MALVAAATVLGVLAVGGCSQHDAAAPRVATVDPTRAASVAAEASRTEAATERPVIRPDMTETETDRLYALYDRCLGRHGFSKQRLVGEMAAGTVTREQFGQRLVAARTACATTEPQQWWQVVADTDPEWPDELHAWIGCLTEHGIAAAPGDGFISFPGGEPTGSQAEVVTRCGLQATGYDR